MTRDLDSRPRRSPVRRLFGCAAALIGLLAVSAIALVGLSGVDSFRSGVRRVLGDDLSAEVRTRLDQVVDSPADAARTAIDRLPDLGATCDEYVSTTRWGDAHEGGESLIVTPTRCTRDAGIAVLDATWTELVRLEPRADVGGMRDQLACHLIGAPNKATWNLEPWRPDAGITETVRARCNPT